MNRSLLLKILMYVGLYWACTIFWQVQQAIGIGRTFVYAVF